MSNRKNDHLAWQQFRTRNPSAVLFRVIDPRLKTDGIEVHMADHVTTLIDPRHPLRQTKGNSTHFERHLSVDTEAVLNAIQTSADVNYESHPMPISPVCGMLWNCTDVIPHSKFDELLGNDLLVRRQTYAARARAMLVYA